MEGFEVIVSSSSGESILTMARDVRPDIALLDVFLGDDNGIDLVRKFRNMPEFANLKIIMTSGMELSTECRAAGADDFLLKPYMPEELILKLKLLAGHFGGQVDSHP